MKMAGFGLIGLGVLGALLSILIVVLTFLSPMFAHVSPDEMIPGFAAGGGCCVSSLLPLILGVVLAVIGMKKGAVEEG